MKVDRAIIDFADIGFYEADDAFEEDGFAAAAGADNHVYPGGLEGERDAFEHFLLTEVFSNVCDAQFAHLEKELG